MTSSIIQPNRAWCAVLIAVFATAALESANAQTKTAIDFVTDRARKQRGGIITKSEFTKYYAYLYQEETPLKFKDVLDAAKVRTQAAEWASRLSEVVSAAVTEDYREGLTVSQADRLGGTLGKVSMFGKFELPGWWPKNAKLLIRRSYEEGAITSPPKEAQGALLSFTRDFETTSDVWEARGSLMMPIEVIPEKLTGEPGIAAFSVMPSVSFDRLANRTDETKEVDSLVPRFGAEILIDTGSDSVLKFHLLRANLAYATDFDLESSVIAGEFQWEPLFDWSEVLQPLGEVLEWRVRTYLHVEIGEVTATGDKASLKKDDSFFRFGPKVQLELFPLAEELAGLSFVLKYEYLEGSSGQPGNSDLFEASMNYAFDPEGHVSLSLAYRNGDVPLTKEAVDSLVIGLSVKF